MTSTKNRPQEVEVQKISFDLLFVSPEETRKTLGDGALAELAKSIQMQGLIEPLLVRPSKGGRYEIVAGQRRWLASKLASQETCRCIVQEMTDDEAAEKRITSNLQREDLPPMEEAEGFGKLLARPGSTIEGVAIALGKAASYVGRRVQLLKAIEPVREALKAGAIEVAHALELARLDVKQQELFLERLNVGWEPQEERAEDDDEEGDEVNSVGIETPGTCYICGVQEEGVEGEWANEKRTLCTDPDCLVEDGRNRGVTNWHPTNVPVSRLRAQIASRAFVVLAQAPFGLNDEIAPIACTECPKRSSNAGTLFEDCAQDTCTDRECYDGKVRAWVRHECETVERAEKRALVLLSDEYSSRVKGAISRYSGVRILTPEESCDGQEQAIWIDGKAAGHRATICRDAKCKTHRGDGKSSNSSATRPTAPAPKLSAEEKRRAENLKAERAKLADKVKKESDYRARLFAAIAQVPDAQIDAPRIQLLTKQICFQLLKGSINCGAPMASALGWDRSVFDYGSTKLEAQVRGLTLQAMLRAAALRLVVEELSASEYTVTRDVAPAAMEQMASWLGIDVKSVKSGKTVPEPKKAVVKKKPVKAPVKKTPAKKPVKAAAKKKGGRK